jgi:hypothetical protein
MLRINLLNHLEIPGSRIRLSAHQFAIVDAEDLAGLSKHRWCAQWAPSTRSFYAVRNTSRLDGPSRLERMHRRIVGLRIGGGRQVDHTNHNTLDNRKANLRLTDARGNSENYRHQSRHGVGISFCRSLRNSKNPFRAQAKVSGKTCYIGHFSSPAEAVFARDAWLSWRGLK